MACIEWPNADRFTQRVSSPVTQLPYSEEYPTERVFYPGVPHPRKMKKKKHLVKCQTVSICLWLVIGELTTQQLYQRHALSTHLVILVGQCTWSLSSDRTPGNFRWTSASCPLLHVRRVCLFPQNPLCWLTVKRSLPCHKQHWTRETV